MHSCSQIEFGDGLNLTFHCFFLKFGKSNHLEGKKIIDILSLHLMSIAIAWQLVVKVIWIRLTRLMGAFNIMLWEMLGLFVEHVFEAKCQPRLH